MASTSRRSFPYPGPSAPVNVNGDIQALAEAVDGAFSVAQLIALTGTAYALTAADAGKVITLSNASAIAVTAPAGIPVNSYVTLINLGAGVVTVGNGVGATLVGSSFTLLQNESASLLVTAANTWFMSKGGGLPKAVISGGSEATLTNPDGDGRNYKKCTFTAASTPLTVSVAGYGKALVVGRGASGYAGNRGSGGRVWEGLLWLPVGVHTVTVPQGATNVDGAGASIGSLIAVGAVNTSPGNGTGAGASAAGTATGWVSTISGSSVEYARSVTTSANPGDGGPNGGAVVAGIAIVRAEL